MDAPGAWTASSAIAGFPLVPFAAMCVFVDALPARDGGSPAAGGSPPRAVANRGHMPLTEAVRGDALEIEAEEEEEEEEDTISV